MGVLKAIVHVFPLATVHNLLEVIPEPELWVRNEVEPDGSMGPCGGNGGDEWDDGFHTGVREITLVHGSCIDSIRVTYDNNGKPFLAEKHGGIGGMKSTQIKLQYHGEFLVSVTGHYCSVVYGGSPVIRSLTLKSNKRTFGPFGVEQGTPFNISTSGGRIVGFYGGSGWFLDSLGVYDKSKQLGPWGGNGVDEWDDGVHSGVREITLVYGSCIDSIRVTYDNNGKPFLAEKHGGFGGTKSAQIKLQFPEEILVSVSGHYCRVVYGGRPVIRSLTLKTNKRSFGPFGVEEGTPFNISTNKGRIVGSYGRSGWFMDSLGVCLSSPKPSLFQRILMMCTRDTSMQLGPWGGNVGNYWDDGVHGGVKGITLVYGSCIDSIRVTYDNDGKSFRAVKIKLQFPKKILVGVSGHFCPVVYGGFPMIRSLTFRSNRRTFGPFGVEDGTPFNFFANRGHIVGFYGRSGWLLDSIGFRLSTHKPKLFQKIQMMIKRYNRRVADDGEDWKVKDSKGHNWGI
ncbi:agglutinin-like [Bidens hawaiensis]|uniref:agglutinin-like n=1 Tax=Bidens hawaiensis TaxID=980011 RepID=UPI004049678A